MVDDAIVAGDVGPDELHQFLTLVGPMQASANQQGNILASDAFLFENPQHWRQNDGIGDRAGNIGNDYAGVFASPRQPPQGRSPYRAGQRVINPLLDTVESLTRSHLQYLGRVGHFDFEAVAAIVELYFHCVCLG